jgi:CubicO group peptidase (beta-lactamase class C family)
VAVFVEAYVRGLQDGGVLATIKHFPGHGDTDGDSHDELPVSRLGVADLDTLHLAPFRAAIAANVASVMTAHVAYPALDSGRTRPATLSPPMVRGLLRNRLGYGGLIVTDALNMSAVSRLAPPGEVAVQALEAGVDMLLMSVDVELAHRTVVEAVRDGRIDSTRIERSVRRILRAKAAAGLHHRRSADLDRVRAAVGGGSARALAETIAERSLTLVAGQLPILTGRPGERLLVVSVSDRTGDVPDPAFREALVQENPDAAISFVTVDGSSIAASRTAIARNLAEADRVVVAVHAFAGRWKKRPRVAAALAGVVDGLTSGSKPATLVLFGTPYVLTQLSRLPDRILLAYESGEAMQRAAAGALSGSVTVTGRLPVTIPSAFAFGAGTSSPAVYPRRTAPEAAGMDGETLAHVDSLIQDALDRHAFPGAAVAVGRGSALAYLEGHGYYTYRSDRKVTPDAVFDLASLTKVVATTTVMMRLYEDGLVELDAPVARYVPEFGQAGKQRVTVRQLLTHTGGLIPYRAFHRLGITTRPGVMAAIYGESLQYEPGTESRYSDFGPIVLAELVERITGRPFADVARTEVFEPLGMWHTGYRLSGAFDPAAIPTEVDDYFRYRTLQGEVHDETAWILGGTAGHAGLFSTARDLARFASMLVHEGRVGGRQFLQPETIRLFTTPIDPTGGHTRALGWDTRSPDARSSAGQLFGPRSFGHTGFTGTSMWIDPDARLFVILLANRVYPTRANSGHVAVRPALADIAYSALRSPRIEPLLRSPAD